MPFPPSFLIVWPIGQSPLPPKMGSLGNLKSVIEAHSVTGAVVVRKYHANRNQDSIVLIFNELLQTMTNAASFSFLDTSRTLRRPSHC